MVKQPYKLSYPEFAESLYQALREDAFYITMGKSVGSGELQKEGLLKYLDYSMLEAERFGKLYIPDAMPMASPFG